MALTDWIACATPGRIARYHITPAGRAALREMLAKAESAQQGMAEAPAPFAAAVPGASAPPRRAGARYCAVESPLQLLARRRRRDGTPFLAADLVAAGERLREDFELAQYGPRIAQDWEAFLTGGSHPDPSGGSPGAGGAARDRVCEALGTLGPGLGDVVLRCCCFLEGMEEAEKHMGWSARSGKIVLRIALERLRDHYRAQSRSASLIG
ncbi:MAG: helix-turn-helix domain containing protein [Rhodobacteraceae bacterium]|nr:helix-turn-helix domain containing protein [Paracoccaceae bacterium]